MKKVINGIVVLVLIAPILLYVWQFGLGLWSTQNDWANLGSYLSGLYTPILTFGTLWVLYRQFERQKEVEDLGIARSSFELAVSVLDRLKTIEMNLADKFKLSCDIKSFINDDLKTEQDINTVHDIFLKWSELGAIQVVDFNSENHKDFKDAIIVGQPSVIAAFDVYFSALEELKSYDHPDIKLMYERLKALGAVLFPLKVLQAYDRDKSHFIPD